MAQVVFLCGNVKCTTMRLKTEKMPLLGVGLFSIGTRLIAYVSAPDKDAKLANNELNLGLKNISCYLSNLVTKIIRLTVMFKVVLSTL